MGSKVEELLLAGKIEIEDDAKTSAAKGDHACCLVVGLGYVRLKVCINVNCLFFGRVGEHAALLEVSLRLNEFSVNQVVYNSREDLADVHIIKRMG